MQTEFLMTQHPLVFYRLRTTTEGIAKPKGVVWSCYSPSGAGFVQSTKPVRIPRWEIGKLACQAESEGIFA